MLVYANCLQIHGVDSEEVVFKAIGAWLKEQLGFGLRPDQLRSTGEYKGQRGEQKAWLRIFSCYNGDPALCAWVLKHWDADIRGRQWIVEVGVRKSTGTLEISCVVNTAERSTLVSSTVSASQPRVIRYILSNVASNNWDASFAKVLPGQMLRRVGQDRDSYRALQFEIERSSRNAAIVLVSPTPEGEYLIKPSKLQSTLIGLAHVVRVLPDSDTWEMAKILGRQWSAWNGAVNVLSIPSQAGGIVRNRLFLQDEMHDCGEEVQRISQVLAWVTEKTNLVRLRDHVSPEGVRLLSTHRRMENLRAIAVDMKEAELRQALIEASQEAEEEQERLFEGFAEENARLANELSCVQDELRDTQDKLRNQGFELKSLKDIWVVDRNDKNVDFNPDFLLQLITDKKEPTPLDCLEVIEQHHGDKCTVLESARSSARKSPFINGRKLLKLLICLVTTYRARLLDGGDNKARKVFGKNEYAAKESQTVMASPAMRRYRTFDYHGRQIEMFRHLKIGIADDPTQTIRVHFHWDGNIQKIVIGYCGEHLPVTSH